MIKLVLSHCQKLKEKLRVARRVYVSTYANMAGEFKIYLNSLPPDKIDEIENDFRANGNGWFLLGRRKVQQNYLVLSECFTI